MSEGVEPPPPMPYYVSIGALRELTHVVADPEAQCPNLRVVNAWATFTIWLRCASISLANTTYCGNYSLAARLQMKRSMVCLVFGWDGGI